MAKNKITITRDEFQEKLSLVSAVVIKMTTDDPEAADILAGVCAEIGSLAESYIFGDKRINETFNKLEKITREIN